MKIEISETIVTKKVIDITLPYYYKHDLMLDSCDSVIYGKIEADKTSSIQLTNRDYLAAVVYELEIETGPPQSRACYLEEKYKSTEVEYFQVKDEMARALSGV